MSPSNEAPARVLVLTPTGRDGLMVCETLRAAGFEPEDCTTIEQVLASLPRAGAAVIAQEALSHAGAEALLHALDAQEPWSDVPILLLTFALTERSAHAPSAVGLLDRANVMLLQRPLRLPLFLSAIRSAVRSRRRQYQMRDLHRELAQAVKLSEMFVGILGHDLRTPLGAITMASELILRSADDARALKPAGRILRSASRMTRMIEQLLDFARVRQGRGIRLQVSLADLGDLVHQVLAELGDANPHARLAVSSSGDLAGHWDPDRLYQVVSNLVGNAIQHGTEGNPISVGLDGARSAVVRLWVENAGTIPAEALPTLFDPFERAETSKTRDKGLGLGLFIAREIVRAHAGDVDVRSESGTTRFDVTLPREARPAATKLSIPA